MSLSKEKIHTMEQLAKHFKNIYQIELFFCEILGQRWSFVAGEAQAYLPQHKVAIDDNLGMMIDDTAVSEKDLEGIVENIRRKLDL